MVCVPIGLTEPGGRSDANSGRNHCYFSADGKNLQINGQKNVDFQCWVPVIIYSFCKE